jgi:hypothetical protein
MTKTPTTNEAVRKSGSGAASSAAAGDVCELLLIELQARRQKLQEILQLVRSEAARPSFRSALPVRTHRCVSSRTPSKA